MSKLYLGSTEVTLPGAGGGGGPLTSLLKLVDYSSAAQAVTTAGATPHTKGAWGQMIASTTADANLLVWSPNAGQSGTATGALCDIGIGAAGAEVVIASNIAIGSFNQNVFSLPLTIPAGSRLAVRTQCVVASKGISGHWATYNVNNLASAASVDVLGTDPATSLGTAMSVGNWVEVAASAAQEYQYLAVIPSASTTTTTPSGELEVGVGAAGSEVGRGLMVYGGSSSEVITNRTLATMPLASIFAGCPAGSRIAVRATTGANHACVIGVPA